MTLWKFSNDLLVAIRFFLGCKNYAIPIRGTQPLTPGAVRGFGVDFQVSAQHDINELKLAHIPS